MALSYRDNIRLKQLIEITYSQPYKEIFVNKKISLQEQMIIDKYYKPSIENYSYTDHKQIISNYFLNDYQDTPLLDDYQNIPLLDILPREAIDEKPVVDPFEHCKSPVVPEEKGKESDDRFKNPGTCVVCMDQKCELVLGTCHHVNMCAGCYSELRINGNKCPTCRASIDSVMRFHEYEAQDDKDKKTVYFADGD